MAAKIAAQDSTSTNASPTEKSTQVDSHVPNNGAYEVVVENGKVYSTYLMWSDMKNNHNKYYIVQALKKKGSEQYWSWIRYGRVGMVADRILSV